MEIWAAKVELIIHSQEFITDNRIDVMAVTWASDEMLIVEYFFSNPDKFPPSFYYIPAGISVHIPDLGQKTVYSRVFGCGDKV